MGLKSFNTTASYLSYQFYKVRKARETMRLMQRLPLETLEAVGQHIIDKMYRWTDGGTQYGLDWPTARMLYPQQVALYRRLQSEYKRRQGATNGK
jgi:hypothetical protein